MSDQPQDQPPATPKAPRQPGTFRIHLLVKDDSGPIQSEVGGTTFLVGTKSKWRAACDPAIVMSSMDRGITLPWGVRCPDCRETQAYRDAGGGRPKPGQEGDQDLVSEA